MTNSVSGSSPVIYSHFRSAVDQPGALVEPSTGRVFTSIDGEEPESPDQCIEIPDAMDLGCNPKRLALAFAEAHMPAQLEQVREAFSRRGAMPRFQQILRDHPPVGDTSWEDFQDEAFRTAIREWRASNGLTVEEDV